MKRILHLKSSIQGAASYSIKLGNHIIEKIRDKYPGSTVEELNLAGIEIPHLNAAVLRTFFIPADQLTEEEKESIRLSDELVKTLFAADIIVIGAPLINFTIHSALKAWIDHITRAGITFGYGADGPYKANDFVAPYLKAFLGFLGMTDLTVFRAEGLKVPGVKEHALERAIDSIMID
jgi:FMN-dependent NADH-azoreductase